MRSMVVGPHLRASDTNVVQYTLQIAKDIASRNANDLKPVAPKRCIASSIAPRLVAPAMGLPVNLDDKPMTQAGEIGRHSICGKLAPEFQAIRSLPKRLPKQDLWQTHLSAQAPGALYLLDRGAKNLGVEAKWAPSTTLRAVPLPVPGRIFGLAALHHHILNTPNCGRSGIGVLRQAANARPSTSRVCTGSMMPSSHSRAVACQGLPCAS